jgi:AAA family ATP:ADP antiporter
MGLAPEPLFAQRNGTLECRAAVRTPRVFNRNAIHRHEWPAVIVAFVYFFCVLAAYYIIRPVRDQLSAAVGSSELPFFYGVVFVVMLVLTPMFGALVARFPRRHFVPVVYAVCAIVTLAFVPLFQMQDVIGARTLGVLFFVWGSVFNLFVVAVFWSFMADLFDVDQSHRLFPVIALGGTLGAITGPLLPNRAVEVIGVSGLLVCSAALLCMSIGCVFWLLRWSRTHPVPDDVDRNHRIIGGSMIAGAILTLKSPFLRRVALLMVLGDCVGTIIYALMADYSHVTFATREARIEFASSIDFGSNALTILMQLTLTRELMVRFGPQYAIALDGLLKALVMIGLIVIGAPWIAAAAVVTRGSAYGMFKPAADSLYTRVDAETRYKGKDFIDTAVWRLGDVVVTLGFNALRALGTALPGFAILAGMAGLASSMIGWRITRAPDLAPSKTAS